MEVSTISQNRLTQPWATLKTPMLVDILQISLNQQVTISFFLLFFFQMIHHPLYYRKSSTVGIPTNNVSKGKAHIFSDQYKLIPTTEEWDQMDYGRNITSSSQEANPGSNLGRR